MAPLLARRYPGAIMHDHHGHDHDHHDHDHHDHGAHGHGHAHGHHHHAPASFGRAFAIGIALNAAYVLAEIGWGLAANSLALLSDAVHNAGDVLALAAAWGAAYLARRLPNARFTYGLRRSSILVALGNAMVLLIATGGIAWEALYRLTDPGPVAATTVMIVAAIGIAINGGTAALFARGRKGDLNIRAAYQHMLADAMVSAGVVVGGALVFVTGWSVLDPIVALAVSAAIVWGTWSTLRDSVWMALDGVPAGIDTGAVAAHLAAWPGVTAVHDLHIWPISTTETALTVHLVHPDATQDDAMLHAVRASLHDRFGIGHATIQLESEDGACVCSLVDAPPA